MAVEIEGSLQWGVNIDFSDSEKEAAKFTADLERRLLAVAEMTNRAFSDTGKKVSTVFNPQTIERFGSSAEASVKSISRAIELLEKDFGAEKLQKLDAELQNITDHAGQFEAILKFIEENASAISIGDTSDTTQILQTIEGIRTALTGTNQVAEQFETKFENSATSAGLLAGQIQNLEKEIIAIENQMAGTQDKTLFDQLNQQTRDLNAQLDSMKARLRGLQDESFGNVGNSPAVINLDTASKKELKTNLQELTGYANKLSQALSMSDNEADTQKYNKVLQDTRTRIDEINSRLNTQDEIVVKVSTRLELVRNQLASMKPSDEGYQELLDEAVQLENRFKNVSRQVSLLGSNTAGVQALKQGINGLVGGFGAAASAMALVSGEEDKMQQTMTKLFLVIQIVAGAEQFLATVNKESTVVQYALNLARKAGFIATTEVAVAEGGLAAAEGAQATAATGAAAAQWSLNAAIAANPVGAMLVAVTAVVGAIALYAANTDSAIEVQTKMNTALAEANQLYAEMVELQGQVYADRTRDAENAVGLAQAEGKSNLQILDLQVKANQAARQEAVYKLESLGYDKQRIGYDRAKLEALSQEIRYLTSIPNDKLSKAQKEQLENLKSQEAVIKSIYDVAVGYFNAINDANSRSAELQAEQVRQARERGITSATAEAEARAIAAKKGTAEELKAQENAINARRRQELSDVNITAGERHRINAQADKDIENLRREQRQQRIADEESLIKAVLATAKAGSIEEFNAKISLIKLEAQTKLDQEGVTSAKIREIKAEELKAIADLNRQYTFENTETDINRSIANINAHLAVVREGTAQELDLKKDLISKQEALEVAKAQSTILNEQNLAIRIKEIHTKSLADRKKLDDEWSDRTLATWMDKIKRDTDELNRPLQNVINSPLSSQIDRLNAQQKILQNNKKALQDMIVLVKKFAATGVGDINALNLLLIKLQGELRDVNDEAKAAGLAKYLEVVGQISGALSSASGALRSFAGDLRGINDGMADTLDTLSDVIDGISGLAQVGGILGQVKSGKFTQEQGNNALGTIGGLAGTGAAIGAAIGGGILSVPAAVIGAVVGALVGAVTVALKGGKKVRESLQKTYEAQYAFIVNQELGEFRINELLRQRNLLKAQENELTLQSIKNTKAAAIENQKANKAEQDRILGLLQQETFISGVDAKKYGGFLGLWRKKMPVNQYASLLGMTVDQIEKLYTSGQLDGRAKALFEQLQKLQAEGQNVQQMLEDLEQQSKEIFTATTADSITDSIVDGFANGKFAAQDFASDFEELMRQAALNSFKFKALEEPIQKFYEQFAKSAESDGVLTEAERKKLQDDYNRFIEQAGEQFKLLEDITGQTLGGGDDSNSLKGAIKGMTEQQADLLAGQFGGLRITAMQQLQVMNNSLSVLNAIKGDTAYLLNIDGRLRRIESEGIKLKK